MVVVIGRGDVVKLEPVKLRLDNWRTALWVWSEAPASGVGVGGFAQAAQAVHLELYGKEPYYARMGGTIPVCGIFLNALNAYTVNFAFGLMD